jgi:hypothetical protein
MKLLSKLCLASAAVFFIGVGAARADTSQLLVFDLTGPNLNVTFELSSKPVIAHGNAAPSCGFVVSPIDLSIDAAASDDVLEFYNNACGGALAGFPNDFDPNFSVFGAQLYRGSVYHPTFAPTSPAGINLTDGTNDGLNYNLTISPVSAPEPSSLLLLGIVLLPLGIAAKRLL